MADSILRLKVDSQEYDNKIRRAAEGIQQYAQKCREAGGTLQYLDDGVLEFVKSLGKMDTVATGTKQQLREMSNALTTLTQTYRGLTDEEKASPFGQELAKGIQQLTERAGQAKDAMMDVEQSIKNAASDTRMFDQMAQGMSVATAGFQGLTGAGKLLGIEMGNDVEVIAKLQSAMAVTNSLTTIQTALQKQSALMQGVQAAQTALATAAQTALTAATGNATAAQAAFNAVANMNPYVALATAIAAVAGAYLAWTSNANKAKKAQEALNTELDNTKNQLSQIDKDTDFSVGIMQAAGNSWKAIHELRLEAARTKLQLADMNYDKLAASGNASAEQMKQAAEMQKQAWDDVMKVLNEGTIHDIQRRNGTGTFATRGNKSTKQEDTNFAADSIMAQEKEVQKLTDAWNRASASMRDGILKDLDAAKAKLEEMRNGTKAIEGGELGNVVVKGNQMKSVTKNFAEAPVNFNSLNTYISGIKSSLQNADLGSDLYESLTEKLKDATTMSTLLQEMMERGLQGADLAAVATMLKEQLLSPEGIDQEAVQKWLEGLNEKIKEAGGIELEMNAQTGEVSDKKKKKGDKSDDDKSFEKLTKSLSTVSSGINSLTSGLKTLGVELPSEFGDLMNVISGIGQVISGVNAIISLTQVPTEAANTFATNANTIAIGALIDALAVNTATNMIPFFANGGLIGKAANGFMVPGNSFSGDKLRLPVDGGQGMIGVNSGEVILNRAQQGVLASELEGGSLGGYNSQPYLDGELIYLGLQAYMRRSGKGEIVTANR